MPLVTVPALPLTLPLIVLVTERLVSVPTLVRLLFTTVAARVVVDAAILVAVAALPVNTNVCNCAAVALKLVGPAGSTTANSVVLATALIGAN